MCKVKKKKKSTSCMYRVCEMKQDLKINLDYRKNGNFIKFDGVIHHD